MENIMRVAIAKKKRKIKLKRKLEWDTGQTEPCLVAFYDMRPGNGSGLFADPGDTRGTAHRGQKCRHVA